MKDYRNQPFQQFIRRFRKEKSITNKAKPYQAKPFVITYSIDRKGEIYNLEIVEGSLYGDDDPFTMAELRLFKRNFPLGFQALNELRTRRGLKRYEFQ